MVFSQIFTIYNLEDLLWHFSTNMRLAAAFPKKIVLLVISYVVFKVQIEYTTRINIFSDKNALCRRYIYIFFFPGENESS